MATRTTTQRRPATPRGAGIQLLPSAQETAGPAPAFKTVRNGLTLESEVIAEFGTLEQTKGAPGSAAVSVQLNASIDASRAPERVQWFGDTILTIKLARITVEADRNKWDVAGQRHFMLDGLRPTDIEVLARALAALHAQMVEDGTLAIVSAPALGGRE